MKGEEMNTFRVSVIGGLLILLGAGPVFGQEVTVSREEIDAMKKKIERLEKVVEQQAGSTAGKEDEKRWYEKIDIAVGATGVLQGASGVKERLNPEGNVTDATASYELELLVQAGEGGAVFMHLEAGNGDGIDGDIPTLSTFNGDADDDGRVRFTEFWYAQRVDRIGTVLEIGKVCLGGPGDHAPEDAILFDGNEYANNERSQFLSGGFINNPALEFPDDNGPGAMVRVSPADTVDVSIGIADADGDWDDVFDDVFSIVEFDFKPKIGERRGHYRIYGWFNGKDHENLKDPDKNKEHNYGLGISIDQEITEVLGLFVRYGWQRGSVSQIEHAWSTGVQCSGTFFGRDDDIFGLAYGMVIIGDDWKDVDRADGINSGNEHHVEFYYNLKVNDYLHISPDIQWVKNPNGDTDNGAVWAFGIRAHVSF
jgi:high affinity Mn2+ porin